MAQNYYEGTGVLKFNGPRVMTPVLRALFGPFHLDENGAGDEDVYIAQEPDTSYGWDTVLEKIHEFAGDMGVALGADEDPDDIAAWLRTIARKLGCMTDSFETMVQYVASESEVGSDAGYSELFDLAMALQDGHNLSAIEFEGCWTCNQMRLGEFGGNGIFIGQHYREFGSSQTQPVRGAAVDKALAVGDSEGAASALVAGINSLLDGITDEAVRRAVRSEVLKSMQVPI